MMRGRSRSRTAPPFGLAGHAVILTLVPSGAEKSAEWLRKQKDELGTRLKSAEVGPAPAGRPPFFFASSPTASGAQRGFPFPLSPPPLPPHPLTPALGTFSCAIAPLVHSPPLSCDASDLVALFSLFFVRRAYTLPTYKTHN